MALNNSGMATPKPQVGGGNYAKLQKLLAGDKLSPAQSSALMAYIAGGGKGGPGMGLVATQAQSEIDPIIAAITGQADAQAQAADKAIAGYTNSYAKQIAGINYGQPYSSAEAQQAAVDAAIRDSLGSQGGQLGNQLSSDLSALQGSSGANAVNQEAAALANQGKQSGNIQYAGGSADLSNLIADAAAANEYGAKMPGVVKLSGLQGINQARGQAQSQIMQGVTQAESELPTIEQQIKANRQNAKALKADTAYKNAELGLSAQRNQISAQRAKISEMQGNARLGIEQQNANTSAERAAEAAMNSNRNYRLSLSRLGIEQKSLQLRQLAAEAKLQGGGYTPEEAHKMQLQANTIAEDASKHQAGLPQLMHTMALNDIPPTIGIKAAKLSGYKPGKVGMFAGLGNAFKKAGAAAGGMAESAAAHTIVGMAHQFIGTPYQWGGESPKGFDCSGFAQYLYGKVGVKIPRTTYTQWQAGHSVPKDELQPGDLVFFKGSDSRGGLPGHVGVYIGGGQMIDAPHTGADVRVESVSGFPDYMGARRYGKA